MAFPPRMIDRLLWPLGLAHGSSFVYFSPSLTRFPLAKRSTRDTILPLCHACHPAPDATFAPLYYTNNKSPMATVSPPPYDLGPCRGIVLLLGTLSQLSQLSLSFYPQQLKNGLNHARYLQGFDPRAATSP